MEQVKFFDMFSVVGHGRGEVLYVLVFSPKLTYSYTWCKVGLRLAQQTA